MLYLPVIALWFLYYAICIGGLKIISSKNETSKLGAGCPISRF
jgi:hypothetical protein